MSAVKNLFDSSLIKYLLVGGINTLFGLAMIYVAKFAGFGDVVSNLFGYSCGLLLSFRLNSSWTFRYNGHWTSAFYRFVLVVVASYILNLSVVLLAINLFGINSYLAQAMGVVPYTIASFLGSKYYAFSSVAEPAGNDI